MSSLSKDENFGDDASRLGLQLAKSSPTVIASDSEAIQTKLPPQSLSLDGFAVARNDEERVDFRNIDALKYEHGGVFDPCPRPRMRTVARHDISRAAEDLGCAFPHVHQLVQSELALS